LMKVVLRQALARLREEDTSLAQMEALAGNLGWDEVSDHLEDARKNMESTLHALQEAVEAAVRVQTLSAHSHLHVHTHEHEHAHPHGHEHPGGTEDEHSHPHSHVHEHPHDHPHHP